MHFSTILGRDIIDSPAELDAQCWLFGQDAGRRAPAAGRLTRLGADQLGRLLAEVALGCRGNLGISPQLTERIGETFGEAAAAAFTATREELRTRQNVKLLLQGFALDGTLERSARLFTEQRFNAAFELLATIPEFDAEMVSLFVRKVGECGGSCAVAARWLACRLTER